MSQQHLHNKIGNAIGECKKRFYESLKNGSDLKVAAAQFLYELQQALAQIVSHGEGDLS